MLKASFVRSVGERDRIYVVRSDGSEVEWAFPSYGDAPPHDLVHLVVEAAFGLTQGFWGRVDAGVNPGAILADANRAGGADRYARFGPALSELLLAETLANSGWLLEDASPTVVHERIVVACLESGLTPPVLLSTDRIARVLDTLKTLAAQWRSLRPKGTVQLSFEASNPALTFDSLSDSTTPRR